MNRRKITKLGVVAATALTGSLLVADVAGGSPGSQATPGPLVRGTADEKIKTRGGGSFDVGIQSFTFQPGGHTGWHSHPGQVIVIVKSGTLTTYDADDKNCTPHVYRAGQVYVDHGYGDAHIARNEGAVPLEIQVTYLDVPVGKPVRIEANVPGNCPF